MDYRYTQRGIDFDWEAFGNEALLSEELDRPVAKAMPLACRAERVTFAGV